MNVRSKFATLARAVADKLEIPEHITALQNAQVDLRTALVDVGDRVSRLEARLDAIRAEAALSALREKQDAVARVHGQLSERVTRLETEIAVMKATAPRLEPPRAG